MPSVRIPYLSKAYFKISLSRFKKIFLSRPLLIVWSLFFGALTLFILLWLPNLDLLFNILTAEIAISEKLDFLWTTWSFLGSSYDFVHAVLLVAISLLQGVSLSLLIDIWQKQRRNSKALAANGLAVSAGALGASCSACGTGLLYPLLSTVGATSSTLVSYLSFALMVFGVVILIYTIHRLVLIAPTID